MISKKQIENILRINGVNPASPDEEIRSILLSARYKQDEVETALMVLRENTKTKKTRVEGLHKVFRTDQTLNSEEISQLLGIEVDIPKSSQRPVSTRSGSNFQFVTIIILSIIIAVLGIVFYMYINEMGLFHQSLASKRY